MIAVVTMVPFYLTPSLEWGGYANIAYGGGKYCIVNEDDSWVSNDFGATWAYSTNDVFSSGQFPFLMHDGARWCGLHFSDFHASTDGLTWDAGVDTGAATSFLGGLAKSPSKYIVTPGSVAPTARTSPDGVTWTPRTFATPVGNCFVVWNGAVFCALGMVGTYPSQNRVQVSSDGITWTNGSTLVGFYFPEYLIWAGGRFVASGHNIYATSPDGITWTEFEQTITPVDVWHSEILWDGTHYFFYDDNLEIHASTDMVTWHTGPMPFYELGGYYLFAGTGDHMLAFSVYPAVGAPEIFRFHIALENEPSGPFWTGHRNTAET